MQKRIKGVIVIKHLLYLTIFILTGVSLAFSQTDLLSDAKVLYIKKDYSSALEKFQNYAKENKSDLLVKEYIKLCKSNISWEKERNNRFFDLTKKERDLVLSQEIDGLLNAGIDYFKLAKYDLALYQFEKALLLDTNNEIALKFITSIKKEKEEMEKQNQAILELRESMDKVFKDVEIANVLMQSGKELYLNGRYELALEKFSQAEQKDPQSLVIKEYIRLSKENIKWEEEKKKKEQIIDLETRKMQMLKEAESFLEQGKYEVAIESFRNLLEIDPQNELIEQYIVLCNDNIQTQQKELKNKIDRDEKYFSLLNRKNKANELFNKGKSLYMQGFYKAGLEYFDRVIAMDSSLTVAQEYKDLSLKHIKLTDEYEREILIQSRDKVKNSITSNLKKEYLTNAKEAYDAQEYGQAIVFYSKILEVEPGNMGAKDHIELCEKLKDFQKEIEKDRLEILYNQAKNKEEIDLIIKQKKAVADLFTKGRDLYKESNYSEAVTFFKKILDVDPKNEIAKDFYMLCDKNIQMQEEINKREVIKNQADAQRQKEIKEVMQYYKEIETLLLKAKELYQKKEYESALIPLNEVLSMDLENIQAIEYTKLCHGFINLKKTEKQREIRESKEAVINKSTEFFEAGKEYFKQAEYKEAINSLTDSWQLYPDASYADEIQELIEESIQMLDRIKKDPQFLGLLKKYKQAISFYEDKKWWDALILFRIIEEHDPMFEDVVLYAKLCRQKWDEEEIVRFISVNN